MARCAKRQIRFEWKGNGGAHEIQTDESQLEYILKNVLLATLSEAKMGSEIEIDDSTHGTLDDQPICVKAHGWRRSLTTWTSTARAANEAILPLRVLLAKHLLERNGGQFAIDQSDGEKETVRLEFPIAEH